MQPHVYDAAAMLRDAATRHGIQLAVLVAETGLWANPQVHTTLVGDSGIAAFFPNRRRYRAGKGEKAGQQVDGAFLDNNSYANVAIKRALGVHRRMLRGFETCHIWPLTCYDQRFHTAIANLVLLPRALAGLTDHDHHVQAVLRFRAYELYNWHPEGVDAPERPSDYPATWLPPLPFSSVVARAIARRMDRPVSAPAGRLGKVEQGDDDKAHASPLLISKASTSQRGLMRALVGRLGRDVDQVIREYAAAEERGEVTRGRNIRDMDPLDYARRLWADGVKKGWL
jgi:hypothetical protein